MRGIRGLGRIKVSTKLSSIVAAALLALCVMGAIAVYTASEIRDLGANLQAESDRLAKMKLDVAIDIERAIGDVNSAPSELDLAKLKTKQEGVNGLLTSARTALNDALAGDTPPAVKAAVAEIVNAFARFETASKKVFEQTAAFAQPEAIATLQSEVAPAQSKLQGALQQFDHAVNANSAAKSAEIRATTATITRTVLGMMVTLVLCIATLSYTTVSRGVVRPITAMTGVMTRLSGGDSGVAIPYAERFDEIGAMGKAVQVFKDNMIKAKELAAKEETERAAKEKRTQVIEKLIGEFDTGIKGVVDAVSSAGTELQSSARAMSATAEESSNQSTAAAAASEQAATNVRAVASSAEELTSSVAEITRQVAESAKICAAAVAEAAQTRQAMQDMAEMGQKIGAVVTMINDIASQTNLLALNATIEAARAGEAGRGFAVVASEVKSLASQTAKATEEIGAQIRAVQTASTDSVKAIETISTTISRVNEIATVIASAVEQQGAATNEIARNVQQAAKGTNEVSSNIGNVSQAAAETGSAATQVLGAAGELSKQSEKLRGQVGMFLASIRAA
jgi:methyl-accepting chemotaxis protein